ncbi:MAG: hypothetical protein R3C56_32090 [Pirellulaceae bacterium]
MGTTELLFSFSVGDHRATLTQYGVEVSDQVVDVFQSYRQANEAVGDASLLPMAAS